MQTLFFGLQRPQALFSAALPHSRPARPSNPASASIKDILDIRFGKAQTVEERARDFAQKHGQRLHQLASDMWLERWKILAQAPDASPERLIERGQEKIFARLNTPAYEALTELLKPENSEQIQDPWLRRHLELLKKEGYIQPDNPQTQRLAQMEAKMKTLAAQLNELLHKIHVNQASDAYQNRTEKALKTAEALWKVYNEQYMALVLTRNEFAKAHTQPGIDNFYDFSLAKQKLTAEDLDRFYRQSKAKVEECETILQQKGIDVNHISKELIERFATRNLTPEAILLKTAHVIGQTPHLEKLLENSVLDRSPSDQKGGGVVVAIDPPHEVRAVVDIPPGAARFGWPLQVIMHEILGHGFTWSFVDPTLPPQFRDEPFDSLMNEGMGRLWESQIYTEAFWTDVLGFPSREVAKLKKSLAAQKLEVLSSLVGAGGDERRLYQTMDIRYGQRGIFFTDLPVHRHNYDLGMAWTAQLEAAMKKKYGGLLNKQAWNEISEVLSLGKVLDWQEQIKLLTSKPEEINEVVQLLRGTTEEFKEGKERIKHRVSGQYFSPKAWLEEMKRLVEIVTDEKTNP